MSLKTLVAFSRPILSALIVVFAALPAVADDAALWRALRQGEAFAIMRHALAPGTGDPADFALGDCATQRNLSDRGRDQARAIGGRFRANGIAAARVYSSQWCRCRETAELLDLGPVTDLPPLNSFFARRERRAAQIDALRAWLDQRSDGDAGGAPLVLVTHQVNISALTGDFTASGEIIVARREADGAISVLGSL